MIPKKTLVALLCLTLAGAGVYAYFLTDSAETERRAHGFVDVKESALSFERAGKIEYLAVEEGESVEKGQVLARLDTEALSHQLKIRAAQCAGLEADHSRLQKGYREEDKAGAEARLKALESSYALATRTCERMGVLYKRKAVSEQERDDACYGARTLKEEVIAARAERDRLCDFLRAGVRRRGAFQKIRAFRQGVQHRSAPRARPAHGGGGASSRAVAHRRRHF